MGFAPATFCRDARPGDAGAARMTHVRRMGFAPASDSFCGQLAAAKVPFARDFAARRDGETERASLPPIDKGRRSPAGPSLGKGMSRGWSGSTMREGRLLKLKIFNT
jgi:hypothetical protein